MPLLADCGVRKGVSIACAVSTIRCVFEEESGLRVCRPRCLELRMRASGKVNVPDFDIAGEVPLWVKDKSEYNHVILAASSRNSNM
jgi:hypothetical protein